MFLTAHDIHPSWHLKMQSAFQEHTTSAVSKTVNLPHNATIKDVYAVYVQAHKLNNIKGVTVYRDGCKEGQVMQAVGTKQGAPGPLTTSSVVNGSRPKKLPGFTDKIETPVGSLYVTINTIQTGEIVLPVEMFLNIGKAGADVTADAEAIGKLASLCLQYNIPVPLIVKHLSGIGGSSSTGFGKNRVKSLPDAVAKVLENNFIKDDSDVDEPPKEISGKRTGNMCPECGVMLVESEGCTKCPDCGYSAC
jgi:ribonucleoside-diphosphate reductase alpha chain